MFKKVALASMLMLVLVFSACGEKNAPKRGKGKMAAESDFTVKFTEDGNGCIIDGYTGEGGAIIIPAKIEGFPVKEIIFLRPNGYKITSLEISEGVEAIGLDGTVPIGVPNIETLILPDSLKELRKVAFSGDGKPTKLANVRFPKGDFTIGELVFDGNCIEHLKITPNMIFADKINKFGNPEYGSFGYGNKLKTITVAKGVKSLPNYIADSRELENVIFEDPDTVIGKDTFYGSKFTLSTQAELKKRIK